MSEDEDDDEFYSFLSEQPIMVNVNTPSGIVQVELEHYAKISTLKEKLHLKIGVHPFQQMLQFENQDLLDEKTLTFHKIKHESIVQLVIVDKTPNYLNRSLEADLQVFYDASSIVPENSNFHQNLDHELKKNSSDCIAEQPYKLRTTGTHVMISYCWAQQKIALKLYKSLGKAGFKVWLDKEEMQGFLCERMAEGVQNAFAVILLMSEDYEKSHACRAEANFSFAKKKIVIPLIAQANFTPSCGWLEVIIAGILYYQVHSDSSYSESFPKILGYLKMLNPNCDAEPAENSDVEICRSGRSGSFLELSGYFSSRPKSDMTDSKSSCVIS